MTGSRLMHWIFCCLVAAASVAGCTSDTTSSDSTGSLNLNLELAEGVVINEVDWTLSGGDMDDMSGTIDTSAPGATASVEVFGLAPGDDYLVELEATTEDGMITCRGSAPFDVSVGVSTDVMVMLNCKRPARLGGVRVNGKFNICAELAKAVVSPLQTTVGYDIDLSAAATDVEGDTVTFVWSATGGSIADSNAAATTYTCGEAGEQTITITVSDDDFEFCMDDWTVPVTCLAGDGDLCEDVTCDDTGNECTTAECDPATGACEASNVEDGTECDGGTCSNGECVAVDLCEGVDCDDQNECTTDACDPADGSCSNTAVDDGTSCNDGAGMCVDGACVDTDLCEGVTCDDTGNDCTVATCSMQSGECEVMNVPNGTDCNGGAGACSEGVCLDDNLCDGVDCSSANDCVQDGTCDPADGSCIAGDNEPADAPCDGGVCDGNGSCGECNTADQCPDDGNDCTAAACDANACSTSDVADGTSCDFGGAPGLCMSGACEDAMLCNGVDCSDGNECTEDVCDPANGSCGNPDVADGTPCDGGAGACMSGVCEAADLCEGVTCDDLGACLANECDSADGVCKALPTNEGGDCDGGTCTNGECIPNAVDPDPKSAVLTVGCTNNVTADVSLLPFQLDVDPTAISGGAVFTAALDGIAEFSEVFLDAAQGAVPGGVTQANLVDLKATVHVRGGAVGADVVLGPEPIQAYCTIFPDQTCDLANDQASVPGSRGNTDCVPTGAFNPCARFVTVPTSDDCAPGGVCDGLGKLVSQCAVNNFCVTGGLPLPLEGDTGSYTAEASGTVLYGWDDESTGATVAGNGTWALPAAVFTAPTGPNGIRVNASGLSVALECTMGVDAGGSDGVGVPDQASPTPDSLLIPFDI